MAKKITEIPTPPPPAPPEPAPVESIPINAATMSPQNERYMAMAMRRLREIILDGQKRRADGRIAVELHMSSGNLSGSVAIGPRWTESLSH